MKDSKYKRRVWLQRSLTNPANRIVQNFQMAIEEECGWIERVEIERYCIATSGSSGDAPPADPSCDGQWHEREVRTWEYVPCSGENPDPYEVCLLSNSSEVCQCEIYGVGCPDMPPGDEPPGDNPPTFDEEWNDNVEDSTNNPCIDSVLKDLSALQNSLPKIIRNFFGKNPAFTPIIKEVVRNHTTDNSGNIIPAPGGWTIPNLTSSTFQIFVNSLYSDATDLSSTATIIHEMFHAHLMNEVRIYNNDSTYIRNLYDSYGYLFPTIFATWLQNNSGVPSGTAHHQAIATLYRGLIADAINSIAIKRGLNLPTGYADDLAWAGCSDSQAFSSLTAREKQRIINVIAAEKDPNNINGINPGLENAKGKPCV